MFMIPFTDEVFVLFNFSVSKIYIRHDFSIISRSFNYFQVYYCLFAMCKTAAKAILPTTDISRLCTGVNLDEIEL